MTEYRLTDGCPACGRAANVRFSESEVRRARRERQAARVIRVQCPRSRCGLRYWLRASDIAGAVADEGPTLPRDVPEREHLVRAGVRTIEELTALKDLTALPGIGSAKATRVAKWLDTIATSAVA